MKQKNRFEDLDATSVVLAAGPLQSFIRQAAFVASYFIEPHDCTYELEQQLAVLHEDEARYHTQEAAWIRRPNVINIQSVSTSTGERKPKAASGR